MMTFYELYLDEVNSQKKKNGFVDWGCSALMLLNTGE